MNKAEALVRIKQVWNDRSVLLGNKIDEISSLFYSEGLDLSSTAAYIKATPSELDALLSLSELNQDILDLISQVDPPKTTWTMLGNAKDEEIVEALNALKKGNEICNKEDAHFTFSEFVYQKMIEVSGPTIEQKVLTITGDELRHILKKGEDFGKLNDWQTKFLKSIAAQKKRGKTLSDKQINRLIDTLDQLADNGVIVRNSVDGDQEICDKVLDILEK